LIQSRKQQFPQLAREKFFVDSADCTIEAHVHTIVAGAAAHNAGIPDAMGQRAVASVGR
jgi:hypothetical protein